MTGEQACTDGLRGTVPAPGWGTGPRAEDTAMATNWLPCWAAANPAGDNGEGFGSSNGGTAGCGRERRRTTLNAGVTAVSGRC